jgi:Iap family predicted aminopeptidase
MRGARYRNVAVVKLNEEYAAWGFMPAMISKRARGIDHIVEHFGHHFVGKTDRCAYHKAVAEAEALAARLNHAAGIEAKPVYPIWPR